MMTDATTRKHANYLFGVCLFLAITLLAASSIVSDQRKRRWPSITGVITSSHIQKNQFRTKVHFRVVVQYSYKVNGIEYFGAQTSPTSMRLSKDQAEDLQVLYAIDQTKPVYYSPTDPGQSFIFPSSYSDVAIGYVVLVVIGVIGLIGSVVSWWRTSF